MTTKEALESIVNDGIRLGAGDFVELEALKVAAKILGRHIKGQLVEVVRCKGCKYGMKSHLQPRHSKNYLCRHSWEGEYHEPDHFCSYAEKK